MLEATHRPPLLTDGQCGLSFDYHVWTPPFNTNWGRHQALGAEISRRPPVSLEQGRGFDRADDRRWFADYAVAEMAQRFTAEVRDPARLFFMQVNIGKPQPGYKVDEPWFSIYRDVSPLPYGPPKHASFCLHRR